MNRSYYLNITPSNVVSIYQNKSKKTSDRPLRSILQEVERDTHNGIRPSPHRSIHVHETPGRVPVSSVCGTPVGSRLNQGAISSPRIIGSPLDASFGVAGKQFNTSTPKQLIGYSAHHKGQRSALEVMAASQTSHKRLNSNETAQNQPQTNHVSSVVSRDNMPRTPQTEINLFRDVPQGALHKNFLGNSPVLKNDQSRFVNSNSNRGTVHSVDACYNKNLGAPSIPGIGAVPKTSIENSFSPQIVTSTNTDFNSKTSPVNKSDDCKTRRSFSFKAIVKSPIIQTPDRTVSLPAKSTKAGVCSISSDKTNVLTQTMRSCENIATSHSSGSVQNSKKDHSSLTQNTQVMNNDRNFLQSSHQKSNMISSKISSAAPVLNAMSTKSDGDQNSFVKVPTWLSGSCDHLWQDGKLTNQKSICNCWVCTTLKSVFLGWL